ncbi:MAG TPA: hypothetical protein VK846_02640 [Candidatus Limnocylindria bacterium]|nr:hypothetical protein [Candidatus Limnocylindria bacterium]
MTKQSLVLIAVAVVLAAVYAVAFTDWFEKPRIQILPQIRPPLRGSRVPVGDVPVYPVTFAFDKKYQFTEIKVVAVDDEKTNKFPHAVWHMISDSNSAPTKAVVYGGRLSGMKPHIPRAMPEPLQPDVSYHLYLSAGKAKGDVKFQTHELVKPQ